MRAAIGPLIERAGLRSTDVVVRGPTLGKKFVLKRSESSSTDKRQTVELLMEARRRHDGGWHSLDTKAPSGQAIPAFLNRDASFAQRRIGWTLTRAARALRMVDGSRQYDVAKAANSVVHQWREVAVIHFVPNSSKAAVDWKDDVLREFGINGDELRRMFDDMVQRAAAPGRG